MILLIALALPLACNYAMNSKLVYFYCILFLEKIKEKNIIPCLLKYVFESCGGEFRFFHLNLIILCFGSGIIIDVSVCVCVYVCVLFLFGFKFKKGKDRVIT